MTSLYIDSSNFLTLGILNEDFEWVDYIQTENLKSSSKLHGMIYEMLQNNGFQFKDIKCLFLAAGPGSYTGIRLSEGVAQILEWQDYPIYSFYHFEVPGFLGEESGSWYSQAFKGEFFIYTWDKDQNNHKLLSKENFIESLKKTQNNYSHYNGLLDGEFNYTSELIKDRSKDFFPHVHKRAAHLTPFYFRNLEQEFSVPGRPIS